VKSLLLVLASLVLVLSVFMSGIYVATYFISEPEPHKFAHLDTPDLWTSTPVRVDETKQAYVRVPGLPIVASLPATDLPDARSGSQNGHSAQLVDNTVTGAVETADGQDAGGTAIDPAHADWCFARYRSYRVEDNSYQPFSGGPRRQCESPVSRSFQSASASRTTAGTGNETVDGSVETVSDAVPSDTAENLTGGTQSRSHTEWCLGRYRSYRVEDNSYQPFDGGPRRACQSPFG